MTVVLTVIGGVAAALLLGGILSFSAFFAPQAFRRLPEEVASGFVRDLFPSYYWASAVVAGIGAAALATVRFADAVILAAVAVSLLLLRYWVMPMAQELYAARQSGVPGAADEFLKVHQRSALLTMLQILAVLTVLVRMLLPPLPGG